MTDRTISARSPAASPGREVHGDLAAEPEAVGQRRRGAYTPEEARDRLHARLLSRLAIADRCTIEGRFLHVNGTRRSYKIHLGSGNVMITPR
jgi:hypothetical protein